MDMFVLVLMTLTFLFCGYLARMAVKGHNLFASTTKEGTDNLMSKIPFNIVATAITLLVGMTLITEIAGCVEEDKDKKEVKE